MRKEDSESEQEQIKSVEVFNNISLTSDDSNELKISETIEKMLSRCGFALKDLENCCVDSWKDFFRGEGDIENFLNTYGTRDSPHPKCKYISLLSINTLKFKNEIDMIDRILIYNAQNGDTISRNMFLINKIPYIKRMISHDHFFDKFSAMGISKDDLEQTAMIGLIRLVDKFDFRDGCTVKTYMSQCTKYTVLNAYRKYGLTNISREDLSVYNNVMNMPNSENLDTDEKIKRYAKEKNLSEVYVLSRVYAVLNRNSTFSYNMDGYINADDKTSNEYIKRVIEDSEEYSNRKILIDSVMEFLPNLSPKEILIIQSIFFKDMTQKEMAKTLKISQSGVSKIKKSALSKIKEYLEKE